jgi:hypothetical protein
MPQTTAARRALAKRVPTPGSRSEPSIPDSQPPRSYRFSDVVEFTHVGDSQLRRWLTEAIVRAELGGAGSSGVHRKFTFFNVVEISIAFWLHEANVSGRGITEALLSFRLLEELSWGGQSREESARKAIMYPESARGWHVEAGRREDVEAKRWAAFKRRARKDDNVGLLILASFGHGDRQHLGALHFVDAVEQMNAFVAHDEPGYVGRPVVSLMIDVAQIVADLEEATGDRL